MFDKNVFKQNLRSWFVANPKATESDVRDFCHFHIPANVLLQYYWLIEQSLEWYRWQIRNERV
jgi:hypothetical protein